MSEPLTIVYECGAGFGFPLPQNHRLEIEPGSVRLEAEGHGGRYVLERLLLSDDGAERRVYLGDLDFGWWDGAPPGVPCSYVFPTADQEVRRLRSEWTPVGGTLAEFEIQLAEDGLESFTSRLRAAIRMRSKAVA